MSRKVKLRGLGAAIPHFARALGTPDNPYPVWDHRHWGIVGDGKTDDGSALQRLFDSGQRVVLCDLDFLINCPVNIPLDANVFIRNCRFIRGTTNDPNIDVWMQVG
jgi:hypothetical protein